MKTRTKRVFATATIFALICCSFAAWTAFKVVAWARDLPSRIVIDGDGLGESLADAVVQSYHESLINGDPKTQIQVLRDFTELVAEDDVARKWVRTEYSSDLKRLASSQNSNVAAVATELSKQLE